MNLTRHSVPFAVEVSFRDVLRGNFEIDGLLSLETTSLLIEYRTSGIFGLDSSTPPLQSFHIAFGDLQDLEYRERIFGTTVILTPRRLAIIEGMPGMDGTVIKLSIKRKHHSKASELISEAQIAFSRSRTDSLNSIPFSLPSTSRDFAEIGGIVYLDDEFLVFEMQSGLPSGSRRNDQIVKIEPTALADIHLDRALLKDVLYIRPKKEQLLDIIPGDRVDALRLKINNTYRADVQLLVSDVLKRIKGVDV